MMFRPLTVLLAFLVLGGISRSEEAPLPNPPLGQVLDRAGWLDTERVRTLEDRLRRYRTEYGVDILVVIWDREIPGDQSLHELARELGRTWAREELWAIIMTEPDPVARPEVHYGGVVAEAIDAQSLETTVQNAVARGLKDWTDQARIEAVATEVGEEFAYLQQRRTQELAVVRERVAEFQQIQASNKKGKALRFVLAGLALLAVLGAAAFAWFFFFRRNGPYEFPETRWRRRLGGDWSGGSTIVASLPASRSS